MCGVSIKLVILTSSSYGMVVRDIVVCIQNVGFSNSYLYEALVVFLLHFASKT